MDAAILRFYALPFDAIYDDPIAQEMIATCTRHGIPICVNRYIGLAGKTLSAEFQRISRDGRFSGFIFYETAVF